MANDVTTAAIYEVKHQGAESSTFVPVMETNDESRELAYAWAYSLVNWSGKPVTIYRNGAEQITLPVAQ